MKKFNYKKLLLLIPAVAITSCGYSFSYLVEGNKYNSPVFVENFYKDWNNEFKNIDDEHSFEIDDASYIQSYKDLNKIDPIAAEKHPYEDNIWEAYGSKSYGKAYKMNSVDSLFNYGYQSKLFDGRVVCDGLQQLSRVQVDHNGFSASFSKESSEIKYVAMSLKATTDNTKQCYAVNKDIFGYHSDDELFHQSTVQMHYSLYLKNDKNILEKYTYNCEIDFTGMIGSRYKTNYGDFYTFFAIDLRDQKDVRGNPLSRVVGFSINYDFDDELINWNIQKGLAEDYISYALFLYELFIPYTSWY